VTPAATGCNYQRDIATKSTSCVNSAAMRAMSCAFHAACHSVAIEAAAVSSEFGMASSSQLQDALRHHIAKDSIGSHESPQTDVAGRTGHPMRGQASYLSFNREQGNLTSGQSVCIEFQLTNQSKSIDLGSRNQGLL
jgi:hypothetical protein